MNNMQIFCDFDGTITKEDTLNKFLRLYADKKWLTIEEDWINGKIGSRECTYEQMKLVPKLSEKELHDFIDGIEIDEYFPAFYDFVKENNIEFYIVSDGFDLFINSILKRNGFENIKVFANRLEVVNGEYICTFPFSNPQCTTGAGMCKCNIVKKYLKPDLSVLYVGDGVSDYCVSKEMETVFAKGRLLEYCNKSHIENDSANQKPLREAKSIKGFNNFKDILHCIKNTKSDTVF